MKHIEPTLQELIIDHLPDDGPLALKIMAQLVGNMILSIKDADLKVFTNDVENYISHYEANQ